MIALALPNDVAEATPEALPPRRGHISPSRGVLGRFRYGFTGAPPSFARSTSSSAPIPAVRCATIEPPEWTPLDLHDRAAGQAAPPDSSPSSWGRLLVLLIPFFYDPDSGQSWSLKRDGQPHRTRRIRAGAAGVILDCACAPILTGTAGGTSAEPSPLPRTPEKG